jgi:hypothetical protein
MVSSRLLAVTLVAAFLLVVLYMMIKSPSSPSPPPPASPLDPASTLQVTPGSSLTPKFTLSRTSAIPYNEINAGERYLIYSPSGGFNNQREEMEAAVEIALLLNRTLFVPMAARHTSMWQKYASLRPETNDLVPMDLILDFEYLSAFDTGVRLVPLNTTVYRHVTRFLKAVGPNSAAMISPYNMKGPDVIKLRSDRHPLLYLHGKGMYHMFFAVSTMVKVRRQTRYAKHMRDMAVRLVEKTFPEGFYAMHVRMGDSAYRFESDGSTFVGMARSQKWKVGAFPVYVATEPLRDAKFFAVIDRNMKTKYSDALDPGLINEFKEAWPKGVIRVDMVGILEQLICVQAKRFIGTRTSTFSAFITFMRKFQDEAFPELAKLESVEDGEIETGLVEQMEGVEAGVDGEDEI